VASFLLLGRYGDYWLRSVSEVIELVGQRMGSFIERELWALVGSFPTPGWWYGAVEGVGSRAAVACCYLQPTLWDRCSYYSMGLGFVKEHIGALARHCALLALPMRVLLSRSFVFSSFSSHTLCGRAWLEKEGSDGESLQEPILLWNDPLPFVCWRLWSLPPKGGCTACR